MNQSESNVYITVSNAKRLVNSFDLNSYASANYAIYIRDVSSVLSIREITKIALLQEIYKTKGKHIHDSVDLATSARNFAFGPKPPAFHQDNDCRFLFSSYVNIEIPVEIKARGDVEIARFKKFCDSHRRLFTLDEPRFMLKVESNFLLKNLPKRIEYANSGIFKDHASLGKISFSIEKLLMEARDFRQLDRETCDEIDRYGNETHIRDSTKKPGTILNIWHYKYKLELKKLLEEYSRLRYNPDSSFDEMMLSKLNFKACSGCQRMRMRRVS